MRELGTGYWSPLSSGERFELRMRSLRRSVAPPPSSRKNVPTNFYFIFDAFLSASPPQTSDLRPIPQTRQSALHIRSTSIKLIHHTKFSIHPSVMPLCVTLQVSSGYPPSHGGAMFHHRNRRGAIMPGSMEAKWAADAAREFALQEQADREAGMLPFDDFSTHTSIHLVYKYE